MKAIDWVSALGTMSHYHGNEIPNYGISSNQELRSEKKVLPRKAPQALPSNFILKRICFTWST